MKKLVTQEQRNYVYAHINDKPRNVLAKRAGISISSLYSLLHEFGANIDSVYSEPRSKDIDDYIRKYFPNTSSSDIAKTLGISVAHVCRVAKMLGITHTEEFVNRKSLVGKRFFRLTVVRIAESKKHGVRRYECICDCGKTHYVTAANLLGGSVKSCGCYRESKLHVPKTHGDSKKRLYVIWNRMKSRCLDPKNEKYKYYGGRGISICEEWMDYIRFKNWAIDNGYENDKTIDRIDNNGNYTPNNCRWTSMIEQNNNRRSNHYITYQGKTQSLAKWSRELGISYNALRYRVKKGLFPS